MTMTVKANLKKPEVLQELLESDIEMRLIGAKLKFRSIAHMDNTLVGNPGDKINVIAYNYLGAAADLAEGQAVTIDKLTAIEKISPVIKKAAKGLQITDEAILTNYGDPLGEAKKQIELSMRDKMDKDIMATLDTAPLEQDESAAIINYTAVLKGTGKFMDEEEERYVMFIHPNQKIDIMADALFEKAANLKDEFLIEGAIGRIAGCDIVVSRRVPCVDVAGTMTYTNYICKANAVKILAKRGVQVEVDRDIRTFSNDVVASGHYVCWLEFGDRVVKLLTKEGYTTTKPTHFSGDPINN